MANVLVQTFLGEPIRVVQTTLTALLRPKQVAKRIALNDRTSLQRAGVYWLTATAGVFGFWTIIYLFGADWPAPQNDTRI